MVNADAETAADERVEATRTRTLGLGLLRRAGRRHWPGNNRAAIVLHAWLPDRLGGLVQCGDDPEQISRPDGTSHWHEAVRPHTSFHAASGDIIRGDVFGWARHSSQSPPMAACQGDDFLHWRDCLCDRTLRGVALVRGSSRVGVINGRGQHGRDHREPAPADVAAILLPEDALGNIFRGSAARRDASPN